MNRVTVLETNILHASDVLYWLDGSTGESIEEMQRIPHELYLEIESKPNDLSINHVPGKTALWRRPTGEIIQGNATAVDKEYTNSGSYTLSGIVHDSYGLFLPRSFSLTLGTSSPPLSGQGMVLYPAPKGVRLGTAGGIKATLRYEGSDKSVPWALLTLSVVIPSIGTQIYHGQADHRGDIILPLHRLPPLPQGVNSYNATLSIRALVSATPEIPVNPDDMIPMELESTSVAGQFSSTINFSVIPGNIQPVRSANKMFLAMQPS